MTVLDRILAAIDDESPVAREDQAALVADVLARRIPRTFHCDNCIQDWPENFCSECGADLPLYPDKATAAGRPSREGKRPAAEGAHNATD